MFIQLGQIKVNVADGAGAHSGAKHKSKKIIHKYITTKQEDLKTTSTSQDNQCWVIELKLTKNKKTFKGRPLCRLWTTDERAANCSKVISPDEMTEYPSWPGFVSWIWLNTNQAWNSSNVLHQQDSQICQVWPPKNDNGRCFTPLSCTFVTFLQLCQPEISKFQRACFHVNS